VLLFGKPNEIGCDLRTKAHRSCRRWIGEPYVDASGRIYLPLVRQPVLIFGADRDQLLRAMERAQERDVRVAIYIEDLFTTYNDIDNRAAIRSVPPAGLNLVGLSLHAERRAADKILKGLKLLR
jgi:hypothetical protein